MQQEPRLATTNDNADEEQEEASAKWSGCAGNVLLVMLVGYVVMMLLATALGFVAGHRTT